MQSSKHARRLKAQMLRAAVQDNVDLMAGRLPTVLRPARRLLSRWARRAWLLALPVSIVLGSALIAHRSLAAQPVLVAAPPSDWVPEPIVEPPLDALPEIALPTRPLRPRALALGVRRVVLDAGHGGEDLGASSAKGLLEKEVTLELAERARRLLVEQGLEVVMTRSGDDALSLKRRSATANQTRGDIFVSIHLNSFEPATARGIETYYLGPSEHPEHEAVAAAENGHSGYSLADMRTLLDTIYADARRDESRRLAQSVQDAMMRRLKTIDAAITDRGVKTAPFVVLVGTDMPAILAEVSCLSNVEEAERLGTPAYRQTIAEALVLGIQGFVDQKRHPLRKGRDSNER